MAEIVLIHGIAQEQEGKAKLEARWIPALADGVRAAGHSGLADRIWPLGIPGSVDVQMAFYGDLFLRDGVQGGDETMWELDSQQQAFAADLAAEWLGHAAGRHGHPDQRTAQRQLSHLDPDGQAMGALAETARALINGLTRLNWFAPTGMAFAEKFVNKSLRQVTKYLTEPGLRSTIQNRVLDLVNSDTRVIIGHSLGSVVAYEIAATRLEGSLPLLLTFGSPLGLQNIIYDRIEPQLPVYPDQVQKWVNIADRNDLVAAEPNLAPLFAEGKPDGSVFESRWTVDNGSKPHQGESYLSKKETGKPIAVALNG